MKIIYSLFAFVIQFACLTIIDDLISILLREKSRKSNIPRMYKTCNNKYDEYQWVRYLKEQSKKGK